MMFHYVARVLPATEITRLRQSLKGSWSARYVAYDSVGGGRMSIVPLSFNECVIHQES